MAAVPFLLTMLAAALHAAWNVVVKAGGDRLVAAGAVTITAGAVNLPVIAVVGVAPSDTWGHVAASSIIHVGYALALVAAYDHGDLSVVYPIARGSGPLFVAVAAAPLLGDSVSVAGYVGVALISISLAVLAGLSLRRGGVGWALVTGGFIASYTLIDGAGVRRADDAVRYIATLFVVHSLLMVALVAWRRRPSDVVDRLRIDAWRLLAGGVGSAAAYLLVMIAAREAPLGLVAGLRETSALFGVAFAVTLLGERVTLRHLAAVTTAAAGAVLIAAS